ncbi:response regulator [Rossellomorea sp. y25]|uniref:response regulator n=1 Tax=Rossellomorea sp. y25 TaxID=3118174 RepID=UPI00260AE63E|nr:response regulator [uncultured Rossellomorea sp.]
MIRIVIQEDQQLLRETMSSLLNLEDDMEVVGQASGIQDSQTLIQKLKPDLFIMDIEMLERDGPLEAGCPLLVLTTFAKKGYRDKVEQADARGYLLKDSPSDELTSSIRNIMGGMKVYSSKLNIAEEESRECTSYEIPRTPKPVKKNYITMVINKMKLPTGS